MERGLTSASSRPPNRCAVGFPRAYGARRRLKRGVGCKSMTQADHPRVVVLPPLLYLVAFFVALGLQWLWPLSPPSHLAALSAGVAAFGLGIGLSYWGKASMRRAGTNVNPFQPTTALVASGPFRFSRNPLYLGLSVAFVGLSLIFNTLWGVVLLLPALAVMHFGVILREERYLEAKFGESYAQYCSEVRRYL